MLFRDVIGQDSVKEDLVQMVANDRLPHALLFLGSEGVGKLALAISLAQYVTCKNPHAQDACGECNACQKVSKLIHPDIHFSFPVVGTKVTSDAYIEAWRKAVLEHPYFNINDWMHAIGAENKQGNINKDECLNIVKKLSLQTFEGNKKVLIIWLPEYLGKEGNRLLKLIEEPPENTLFILVAERDDLILNTILSRCQIVTINKLKDEEIKKALVEKRGLSEADALELCYLADGNYNEAAKLSQEKHNDYAALFIDWLRLCYAGKWAKISDWVEVFSKLGRENQKYFIGYALHFVRELLVLKFGKETKVRLSESERNSALKMGAILDLNQIQKITELLNESSYFIERNANPKVLFFSNAIELNKIFKNQEVDAMVSKVKI